MGVHAFNPDSRSRLDKHQTGAAEPSLAEVAVKNPSTVSLNLILIYPAMSKWMN